VAFLVNCVAKRALNVFWFIVTGVEAVSVSDGLVDIVVVQMDIDLRTITAGFPSSKFIELFIAHERRYLGQPGMAKVVGSTLVFRYLCGFTRFLNRLRKPA